MIKIKRANNISWLIAIIVVNNIVSMTPSFGAGYYSAIIITLGIALLNASFRKVDAAMLCLYLSCILSIFANDVPSVFKPWERLASFFLISTFVSPFLKSEYLWFIRLRIFTYIQKLLEFVAIGSIIAYFVGAGMGRGGFCGITGQAMLIAPISANAIITSVFTLTNNVFNKKQKAYYITVICSGFLCLLLAASRTALVAAMIAVLFYFYKVNKGQMGRFTKYMLGAGTILVLLFPLWSPYLDNVKDKNEGSMKSGGITSSRDVHWKQRINEWKSSPIFGIGFASVDTEVGEAGGANYDPTTGAVETGTSWLCVLSMTGILGFSSLLALFIMAYIKASRFAKHDKRYSSYLIALLIFWAFHMMAEGYIFAGGSFLFFNVWLLLGCADAVNNFDAVIAATEDGTEDEEEEAEYESYEDCEYDRQ